MEDATSLRTEPQSPVTPAMQHMTLPLPPTNELGGTDPVQLDAFLQIDFWQE